MHTYTHMYICLSVYVGLHWHRLVKIFGWANQNIGGKVVKSDKFMGVSQ